MEGLFFQIGGVLVIAALLSLIVYRLGQPLIIAYILTGIIAGPGLLALNPDPEIFHVMSEIGVAFLLFSVGLGLNWKSMKDVGGISIATGVGQVLFTSLAGFVIGLLLGFTPLVAGYLAVAFAFSSTIIIIKLLMDKEDLDSLYGRISVGFLLVQDFIAMLILLGLGAIGTGADIQTVLLATVLKAMILIPVFWFVSTRVMPPVLGYVAKSQELLLIFAVAWCFFIAGVLVKLGFGVELGALIAGLTLSGSVYYREINARIRPLRDFFLIIFFIVLGTQLGFDSFMASLVPIVIFSVFILVGNPLIVLVIMRLLGYHPRTGFLAGTTVAQISEFSFIVIVAGIAAGHLGDDVLALSTAVGLITIAGSSYLIMHNERIYQRFQWVFKPFEPRSSLQEERLRDQKPYQVVLMGWHRTGQELLKTIKKMKKSYVVVDFDPLAIRELAES